MLTDGDCKVGPAEPGNNRVGFNRPAPGPITITKPVGVGAPNVGQDVVNIQHALDTIPPIDGGPSPQLIIDGKCGPKTIKAIRDFQIKHFGISKADGRVDPDKRTIQKINELKNDNIFPDMPLSFADPTHKALFDGMMQHIPHTKDCINAAMSKLMAAIPTVDVPNNSPIGPSRAEKMSLINRHFKIDNAPAAPRQPDLQKINDVYGTMLGVLNKPENFFTLDTDNSGVTISTVAFARLGGFFNKVDLSGRIVFRSGVLFATGIPDFAAFIIIHELRHFVERSGRGGHFGKGWITDPAMQALGPKDAMDNCDTYAGFALEAKNGIMQRPVFVKSSVFR
jgi:peptidoglycan hydrolase-like protein with peptidoglycan-binding domain